MSEDMNREPEGEVMADAAEVEAYARADFADVNQAFVERLLRIVGPREHADAVDLGTGPADIPLRVLEARPGWRIVAVDASQAMLEYARQEAEYEELGDSLVLVQADAKNTGLLPASFDVLFSNSILHHITEVDAFWRELTRIARPGAAVFLRDLARPRDRAGARRIIRQYAPHETELLQEEYYRSLLSSYTPAEVRQQLQRVGLQLQVEKSDDRHLDVYGHLP